MGNATGKDKGVVDEEVAVLNVKKDIGGITSTSTKTDDMVNKGKEHHVLSNDDDDDGRRDDSLEKLGNGVQTQISEENRGDGTVAVSFKWKGMGTKVAITGSFNNWQAHVPLILQKDGSFGATINVLPGKYEYKFIVDGDWKVDPQEPVVKNQLGSFNNLRDVLGQKFVIPYTSDSMNFDCEQDGLNSGRASPEGDYGQEVPDVWNTKPPRLPPHLLKVTLNAEPENNDPTQLPIPNHVMLNHLYALSIKDNMIVLGSSSRYKKKFVTTVVYKPMDR
eukprot:m.137386 g.137386  ORF g.137386 m.137386 type:complete len:277 (+) comp11645_c0_seq1:62-892(+)